MLRVLLVTILAVVSFAPDTFAADKEDAATLDKCLRAWKKNPFRKNPDYRVLKSGVKVLGVGGAVEDNEETKSPQLILVEPSVSVLTKASYKLMNPNGWYCFQSKVDVLAKTSIELHCKANLATSSDAVTILGSNDKSNGVTVLGKTEVKRVGCGDETAAKPKEESED